MSLRGPTKIVLIRSGGYAYAELDLHEPLQLVAGNNVGKTTLIAALQFLFIDDLRSMGFSQGPVETRRHYFPHLGSLVLFECLTPVGFQVVGARGLGPGRANEFERFVYQAQYDRQDFVDGAQVLRWEDLLPRLVAKDLYFPDARAFQASILGTDKKRAALDIVPLARVDTYGSFKFLFRNLLRLSHIDEKQLRMLLIDVAGPRVSTKEVDLRRDYANLLEEAQRQTREVDALRRLRPVVERLDALFRRREQLRGSLSARWAQIEARVGALKSSTDAACLALQERDRQINEIDRPTAKREQEAAEQAVSTITQDLGMMRGELEHLEQLEASVRGYLPSFEESRLRDLRSQCEELSARLRRATTSVRGDLERRLKRVVHDLQRDERTEAAFARVAATWLRTHAGLERPALDDVFRVLNPELLGAVVEPSSVEVDDERSLIELLKGVSARFTDEGFYGAGVRLPRSVLPADSPLSAFDDVSVVRERLEMGRRVEAEIRAALLDVEVRDALASELELEREKLDIAEVRRRAWAEWENKKELEAGLRERVNAREDDARSALATLRAATTRLNGLDEQKRQIQQEIAEARRIEERQLARVHRLSTPPSEWAVGPLSAELGRDLPAQVEAYAAEWGGHSAVEGELRQALSQLEEMTGGQYVRGSEAETLALVTDDLNALPDRESSTAELWNGLVRGLRGSFAELLAGAEAVERDVSKLNSAIGQRRVSNLQSVAVEFFYDEKLVEKIRMFIKGSAAPLLASLDEHEKATADIVELMKNHPRIELVDLFHLHFRVTGSTGTAKVYGSLSQIESQGTSLIIKILVHVALLRKMLNEEVTIPYYVDEVGSFDDRNLAALIDYSTSSGFVPIFAGPDPKELIPAVYVIRKSSAGLILDGGSKVRIRRRERNGA